MEIDREWGPLCRIKFVRVPYRPETLVRMLPMYKNFSDQCIVPNLFKHYMLDTDDMSEVIVIPVEFATKVLLYCARCADDAYKFNNVSAYISSQMGSVIMSGTTVWRGWSPSSPEEAHHLSISLFIMGAMNRRDRTTLVSKAFSDIQSNYDGSGLPGRGWLHWLVDNTIGTPESERRRLLSRFLICLRYRFDPFKTGLERFMSRCQRNLNPQPIDSLTVSGEYQTWTILQEFNRRQAEIPEHNRINLDDYALLLNDIESLEERASTAVLNHERADYLVKALHSLDIIYQLDDGEAIKWTPALRNDVNDSRKRLRVMLDDALLLAAQDDLELLRNKTTHVDCTTNTEHEPICGTSNAESQTTDVAVGPDIPEQNNTTTSELHLDDYMLWFLKSISSTTGKKYIACSTNDCQVTFNPPHDGYCILRTLQYLRITNRNNLINVFDAVNRIREEYQGYDIIIHLIRDNKHYHIYPGVDRSNQIIKIAYDADAMHFYITDCTLAGGLIAPCIADDRDYFVDEELWKSRKDMFTIPREKHRVEEKIASTMVAVNKVLEIGYAPGHFAKFADAHLESYVGYHYIGQGGLELEYKCKQHKEFNMLSEVQLLPDHLTLIDIGDKGTLASLSTHVIDIVSRSNQCIVKCFLEDTRTFNRIAKAMDKFYLHKPSQSMGSNSEVYLVKTTHFSDGEQPINASIAAEHVANTIINRENDYKLHTMRVSERNIRNFMSSLSNSKLHTDIKKGILKQSVTITLEYTTGVAGCGKTRSLKLARNDAYVAPLRALTKGKRKAMTHEVFLHKLLTGATFDVAYVDECFMLPRGWYGAVYNTGNVKKIVCLGDPHQIPLVDFEGDYHNDDQIDIPSKWHNNKSLRFGPKSACLVNHMVGSELPDIVIGNDSKNDNVRLVEYNADKVYDITKNYKVITFFQANKLLFDQASTIHEAQGLTFPKVCLYVDGKELNGKYINNYRYTYVGMTRHEEELMILYNSATSKSTFINEAATVLHINMNKTNSNVVTDVQILNRLDRTEQVISDPVCDVNSQDLQGIENILNKAGFIPNDSMVVTVNDSNIPAPIVVNEAGDHTKARVIVKGINAGAVTVAGYRPSTSNFVRHYHNKSDLQNLLTMRRYTAVARRMKDDPHKLPYFNMIEKLQRGFLKFTEFADNPKAYYEWMQPTFEELQVHAVDYLQSLQDKVTPKVYEELNTLVTDMNSNIVDFFMKKQPKYMDGTNITKTSKITPDIIKNYGMQPFIEDALITKQKAGQGVSAWSKKVNLLFACYMRHMMLKLTQLHGPKGAALIIGVGKSDQEIGIQIAKALNRRQRRKYKYLATDFKEHDTSHGLVVKLWFCYDMLQMGFPMEMVHYYFRAYAEWRQIAHTGSGSMSVINVLLQHSGSPDTIHGNTKLTMGANGACFDFIDLIYAAFKGDDSNICAASVTENKIVNIRNLESTGRMQLNDRVQDFFGFKLKMDFSDPTEFICNFITEYGFFPDVVRRAARYISKIYVDRADFELTRSNIKDAVRVVTSPAGKNNGIYVATKYYNDHGMNITQNDVEALFNFLANDTLKYVDKHDEYILESYQTPMTS